jgi:soluble lytic murein transglycosylase-like protein
VSSKRNFAILACAAALGGATVAHAAPADLKAERGDRVERSGKRTGESIEAAAERLRRQVQVAREKHREEQLQKQFAPSGGSINGVSLDTLNAIAACESGGSPTAVNAAGYYGKYQFDMGTWASVGGSGNPAEASEAEQDYRAAMLYSRAGSSPWPVCGA